MWHHTSTGFTKSPDMIPESEPEDGSLNDFAQGNQSFVQPTRFYNGSCSLRKNTKYKYDSQLSRVQKEHRNYENTKHPVSKVVSIYVTLSTKYILSCDTPAATDATG